MSGPNYFSLRYIDKPDGYSTTRNIGPVTGKGAGDMHTMGSSKTGIYIEPAADFDDIDTFVDDIVSKKVMNKTRSNAKPRDDIHQYPDTRTLTKNQARLLEKEFPKIRSGMSPFSYKTMYGSDGFSGSPLGAGGAEFATRSAGVPARKTGTLYGYSHATVPDQEYDYDDEIKIDTLGDIPDPMERSFIKQNLRLSKILRELYIK